MSETLLPAGLAAAIAGTLRDAGAPVPSTFDACPVHGGCINRNLAVGDDTLRYFVKIARDAADRFAGEADGLAALARCSQLVVPRLIAQGSANGDDFLVLEWLDLSPAGDEAALGEALAALHDSVLPAYGWRRDNHLGSTAQINTGSANWADFFVDRRLRPQLARAAPRFPGIAARSDAAIATASALLADHRPAAALLHGDLWRGNAGFVKGRPALFDPAVHAGDRECDLAMAGLFGGFAPAFFAAYRAHHPERPGDAARRRLYALHHLLNHANLFGGDYARQAAAVIDRLTAG